MKSDLRAIEQPLGRAVDDGNAALGVETDDAGADAREHRLGEAAALIDLVARADDVFVLRAKLLRHLVEAFAQVREIALAPPQRNLDVEISGSNEIGGADQAADRGGEPIGEIQSEPHRGQQQDQRDDRIHQREGDLYAEAPVLHARIFGKPRLGRTQILQHLGIDGARDVEIGVVEGRERHDGGDKIGGVREINDRPLRRRLSDRKIGGNLRFAARIDVGAFHDRGVAMDHHRDRKAADRSLGAENFAKPRAVFVIHAAQPRQIVRHGGKIGANSEACSRT